MAPVVSFQTNPSVLVESEATSLVFTFQLSEPPPSAGIRVTVNGNVAQNLTQLNLPTGIDITGGEDLMGDFDFSGFDFTITSQTATISIPIFSDNISEEPATVTYTLAPGQGYTVNSSASQDSVVFRDTPAPITNNPPAANDDSGSTLENQVFNGNVLSNDSDPNGDSLVVTALNGNTGSIGTQITLNSNALLTLNGNGSYVYNPNGQFNYLNNGQTTGDTFSYTISDGKGGTDTAIVTITINGVSDVVTPPPPPPVDLNPAQYGASYPDLIINIGYNLEALTNHYINAGQAEGRSKDLFDEFRYIASNSSDLAGIYGLNGAGATEHYIRHGFAEGRPTTTFIPSRYLLSYDDLLNTFGSNTQAATSHYITNGASEGRSSNLFPSDRYIASHGDLIQAFRYNLEAGSNHYLFSGAGEGRQILFDPQAYLNRYSDLQQVFGNDLAAATRHYIQNGFDEGRTWM